MRILQVKHAGFCFGVKNALKIVLQASARGSVCTLGELIHNQRTIQDLADRGIFAVALPDQIVTDQVVIRSHGAAPEIYDQLREKGVQIVDATCPFVSRIHEKARQLAHDGIAVFVIGQETHPEVMATMGWAGKDAVLIDSPEQIDRLGHYQKACVIGQTTYSMEKRDRLLSLLRAHVDELEVFDFVCATTSLRQNEVRALREKCDVVLVVGDAASANTRKLYEIASERTKALLISCAEDLKNHALNPSCVCGITGGASAPPQALEEVTAYLQERYPCTIETIVT